MNSTPKTITTEWLLSSGFSYDGYTYSKGGVWIAPTGNGRYDVFLKGLQEGVTCTIWFQKQAQDLMDLLIS